MRYNQLGSVSRTYSHKAEADANLKKDNLSK